MADLVAYLRVSTKAQLDGGGLDVQDGSVRSWADENGHVLPLPTFIRPTVPPSNTKAQPADIWLGLRHVIIPTSPPTTTTVTVVAVDGRPSSDQRPVLPPTQLSLNP